MGAKLDRIGADLEKARKKRAEWDARVKDLERRYREEENSEIHEMVHAANLTPDQLSELLRMFAADMAPKPETSGISMNIIPFFNFHRRPPYRSGSLCLCEGVAGEVFSTACASFAMEDDYGMLDGIINNGKAPAAEDRPSVLEQLKEMSVFDTPHKPPRSHPERDME